LTELYFEKLQADFDSRVVKQSQNKHANKQGKFNLATSFDNIVANFGAVLAPKALAVC